MKKWVLIGALAWLACAGYAYNLTIRAFDVFTHEEIVGAGIFFDGHFTSLFTPHTLVSYNPGNYSVQDVEYPQWFPYTVDITPLGITHDEEFIFWGIRNQYPLTINTQMRISPTEYVEVSGLEIWKDEEFTGFYTPHTFIEPTLGDYTVSYPGESWGHSFPVDYGITGVTYPAEAMFTVGPPTASLPVVDVGVAVNQNNAELAWQPYSFYIAGQLVPPDYYFVYSSLSADGPFSFLSMSPTPSFTHYYAVQASPKMFYRVTAVLNVRRDLPSGEFETILRDKLKPGMSETEAMAVYRSTQLN